MKLAFIDVETTGLDPQRHAIWCIGGILEVNNQEVDRFRLECAPHEGRILDPEALKVGKVTEEQVRAMPPPQHIRDQLEDRLCCYVDRYNKQDKWFFLAYNALFDYGFLRAWWEACGDAYFGSYFWHPPIDVMTLAAEHLMPVRHLLSNFKLATVCEKMHVHLPPEAAHDALHDIEAARLLWQRLELWQEKGGQP